MQRKYSLSIRSVCLSFYLRFICNMTRDPSRHPFNNRLLTQYCYMCQHTRTCTPLSLVNQSRIQMQAGSYMRADVTMAAKLKLYPKFTFFLRVGLSCFVDTF